MPRQKSWRNLAIELATYRAHKVFCALEDPSKEGRPTMPVCDCGLVDLQNELLSKIEKGK